jgi:hypothetical protein
MVVIIGGKITPIILMGATTIFFYSSMRPAIDELENKEFHNVFYTMKYQGWGLDTKKAPPDFSDEAL